MKTMTISSNNPFIIENVSQEEFARSVIASSSIGRDLNEDIITSKVINTLEMEHYSTKKAFTMEVMEDCIKIEVAPSIYKTISLIEFRDLFLKEIRQEAKEEASDIILPPNTISFSRAKSTLRLECFYPETIAKVRHFTKNYEIPFPNTLVMYELKTEGKGNCWTVTSVNYKVYTGDVNQLTSSKSAEGKLKQMPFPNFYTYGSMCYGGNSMPNRFVNGNLKGLKYYYDVIFLSPFNNDLGVTGTKTHYGPEAWFKHLATLKTFPYTELI